MYIFCKNGATLQKAQTFRKLLSAAMRAAMHPPTYF
jgi:hypothetical protein